MEQNLYELAQNKLLILYIIKHLQDRLTENDLSYFILDEELLNYFYFKQYMQELETMGLILFDNDKKYYLSHMGEDALALFIETIPEEITQMLNQKIERFSRELKRKNSILATVEEEGENSYAHLQILEGDVDVLNLKLEVSHPDMAQHICHNFREHPQEIYDQILNILLDKEKDEVQ